MRRLSLALLGAATVGATPLAAQDSTTAGGGRRGNAVPNTRVDTTNQARRDALKAQAVKAVDSMATFTQQMVDQIFSYGELGMQETETSKYLVGILRKNGFTVQENVAGMPTGWVARWGSGKPVIALGSDIDGIPQASQKPGVGYRDPMIEGAPGHGEGHNSGNPLNVTAALAVKKIMERDHIPGTIVLFPGVAEELMAGKAFYVRAGIFKDVDAVLFSHVDNNLGVSYGQGAQNALLSAEFKFRGTSAHAAGNPQRGRSALDAVMLMGQAWEFHREHMGIAQRSHYVIRDGGDQPNVVPSTASIWFYFRNIDYPTTMEMFEAAKRMAQGAALMTDTKVDTIRILGSGWSGHFNKPIAEAMASNMSTVGLPTWDAKDQALARGIQKELGVRTEGLATRLQGLGGGVDERQRTGGGSDDIGDVAWNVPTVTLRYPANIPGLPGHNWANAIAMATPIAHKGTTAGAKVQAMTMIDLLLSRTLVSDAMHYFTDVQTKDVKYKPFISATDQPPIELNREVMARYRDQMRKLYYDPTKYRTYLEQLGIKYPTVRADTTKAAIVP
ncbi:amidohydrolase [Gemmatirosa kalamazoonensis]|jgi:aminobenzoyl-glutamate utilization protein B|uniref:Amidohydrolase n=1 Tax=Gemmatirosa kalamazoonensis TaxID=861299 RepID=W0RGK8_9BACT|nr:amidohydrolase [Gemmatirosa kalamazoonensis]AHG89572.1 amidohydrolase [Gemmatirosa kalamazoonensis]